MKEYGKEVCYIKFYEMPVGHVVELKPHSELVREWNQKICPFNISREQPFEPVFIEEGRYRFIFRYGLNITKTQKLEPWKRKMNLADVNAIYSNEFTIKEKQKVILKTDKTEYEQGEVVKAILDYKGSIYVYDSPFWAWQIQKWENNSWIDIKKRGDRSFACFGISECKDVNLEKIENCPPIVLCERIGWTKIEDGKVEFNWDQYYNTEIKTYQCKSIQTRKIENRTCAIFEQAEQGRYKIRFEYALPSDIPTEPFFDISIARYIEKEIMIK